MVDPITGELEEENADAAAEAAKTPQEIAAGILSTQGEVGAAMAALTNQIENEKTRAQEIAYLIGVLTSTELANGLKDKRPGVRAQAEATREIAEKRLAELQPASGKIGSKANQALAAGMKSKDADVRRQAQRTKGIVQTNIRPNTKPAGAAAGQGVINGLNNKRSALAGAARRFANLLVTTLAQTINAGLNTPGRYGYSEKGRALGGPVRAGEAYIVGERRPELFVPDVPGTIVPRVPAAANPKPWGGGTTQYQINMPVQGALRVRTLGDVVSHLRRLGENGLLPPATDPPAYWHRETEP
jgi:hypothetical protein